MRFQRPESRQGGFGLPGSVYRGPSSERPSGEK